jgi:hypothetical protein
MWFTLLNVLSIHWKLKTENSWWSGDRRHHRYSSGSDSLQSTNSFTSFINVINLIFLLGEVNTFFTSKDSSYMYMYLLPSRKNWLMKPFSNEIKSQTFSRLWPGLYLFWLTKRNTTDKIPGTSTVYWVTCLRATSWHLYF